MADHVIETATDTRLQCRVPVHPGVGASLGLGKEEAAADEWGVHGKSCPSNSHKQRAPLSSPRWNVTAEQRYTLEAFFEQAPLPSRAARQLLATKMGVSPQQIKVWFRNARQRKRQGLGGTEVASLGPHVGTLQPVARVAGSPYNNTYGVYAMSCL
ncbi:zinc finger protein (homeobox domain) [Chrysochromulina tobinii]|uniref:Zinc finger protein (Homeobox domain) n=1 Tax=Chrysochromulina tobinii TaxID=1460289 RepID=A0A0M0JRZ2_9EUKA|nr:zinc finger protein (homeobox domain) [Chrysochromulina tobinii]|eukprot:KOO29275.1 zinc finger protein (homeobox domain) [Chrysochromulina sp. CCMP291]